MKINHLTQNEKLLHAYNHLVERVRAQLDAGDPAHPKLWSAIEAAKEEAVATGELSQAEADQVGEFLSRDVEHLGQYIARTQDTSLADWLRFDIEAVETGLLELLLRVADQGRLEMFEFQRELDALRRYHAGEVAGPGTFRCTNCGDHVICHAATVLTPCPTCEGRVFNRLTAED